MRSEGSPYFAALDRLRAVAILAVIAYHASNHLKWSPFSTAVSYGWCGVDLFFVISGFLITGILLRSRSEEGYFFNFYMRRVLRIWPLYFAFLFVMLVALPIAVPSAMTESLHSARPAWAFPLFLQNLLIHRKIVGPLGVTWSLAIEEQFYMLWPLFVWKFSRVTLKRLLYAVLVIEPVLRVLLSRFAPSLGQYTHTLTRLDGLAVGCLLALLAESFDISIWRRRALQIGIPALGVVALSGAFQYRPLLFSAVAVAMGAVVAFSVTLTALPCGGFLQYTGRISYGLYLIHLLAFDLFDSAKMRSTLHGNVGYLIVSLLLTYALASVSFYVYETPINSLKRFFRASSVAPPAINAYSPDQHPVDTPKVTIAACVGPIGISKEPSFGVSTSHPPVPIGDPSVLVSKV
jgi:peptidoglycan/LPS O-acetylase OafA/YrhL